MSKFTVLLISTVVIVAATASLEAGEYVVAPGDTLSKIAQSQLGSARRWKEIAALNNIKSPYSIRGGQLLILPDVAARPPRSDSAGSELLPIEPPGTGIEFPRAESPINGPPEEIELPAQLWVCVAVALVVFWAFSALCLRIGCWFSLVETSFPRCVLLSLLSAATLMLLLGVLAGLGYLVLGQHMSPIVFPVAAVVLFLAYVVVSIILTKRILACKWRSVLTVGVMAGVVADLLALGLMVILFATLPSMMATESLRAFVTAVMYSQ